MPKYPEANMQNAINAVQNGTATREAARDWGVPLSTLSTRVRGTRPRGLYQAEVQQKLSIEQEQHLASWIRNQESLGVPVKHAQIRVFATRILQASGSQQTVGKRWIQRFIHRHTNIKTKKDKSMDSQRINGASTKIIKEWFQQLNLPAIRDILCEDRYNMDKIGIIEGMGINGLCVGSAETKTAIKKHPESRIWTTIIECISADNRVIKPLVIFKGGDVQQQWFPNNSKILDSLRDWQFTTSENGWTSNAISLEWLQTVFIPQTRPKNPKRWRLLIVDGHGSHISDDFIWDCFNNKIYMLFLPAHASHVLQPLDLSIFSPLKSAYRKLIDDYNLTTDSAPIHKRKFIECYALARKEAIIGRNIRAGWKATGLWPVNSKIPLKNSLILDLPAKKVRTPSSTSSPVRAGQSSPLSPPKSSPLVTPFGEVRTPRRSQEVQRFIYENQSFRKAIEDDGTARQIFNKMATSLDRKAFQLAEHSRRIQRLEAEVEELRPKKRKKVVPEDPNKKFVTIENVIAVKENLAKTLEATKANTIFNFEDMCTEWSIYDVVV